MNPKLKKDFEEQFDAKIERGTRRFFRKMPLNYTNMYQVGVPFVAELNVEEIPSLMIHISEEEFEHMTKYIPSKILRERKLREDIPAVQKAWDNYQLLLKMCGEDYR